MAEVRARTARTIEEMRERRARTDTTIDGARRMKLRIPSDVETRLKEEGRTPRWVIKDSARMQELLSDDGYYSRVEGVGEIPTRSLANGEPIKMVLLSKPTEFIEEDKAALEVARAAKEKAEFDGTNLGANQYLDPSTRLQRGGSG